MLTPSSTSWLLASALLLGRAPEGTLAQFPPAPVPTGCTTNSFQIPSWFIQDFSTRGLNGTSFGLLNRATNTSVQLTCAGKSSSSSSGWAACTSTGNKTAADALGAWVRVAGSEAASVQVQQSWTCNDRDESKPVAFTASGNTTVPLKCGSVNGTVAAAPTCKSTNPVDLIRGTLSKPITITPAWADGPDGHDKPGCQAASKSPLWTLDTVIFINETGDGTSAIPSQSIQFAVTNNATGEVQGCLMYFLAGPGEDPAVRMTCGGGGPGMGRRSRYNVQTNTVFYPRSRQFNINQTWFCDDVDAARPVQISGTATTTLDLECTTEGSTTNCLAPSIPVKGTQLSETQLPPYAIEDPIPTTDGCTISSVLSPSWSLSNFEIDYNNATSPSDPGHDHGGGEPAPAPAGGSIVSFNMRLNTLNNFDFPVFVNHLDVKVGDAETWYPCSFGPGEQPLVPKKCEFRYHDAPRNELEIKADWVCIDIDASNPIMFSGVATTKLPELSCLTTNTGLTRCSTREGFTWLSNVADPTWKKFDGPL